MTKKSILIFDIIIPLLILIGTIVTSLFLLNVSKSTTVNLGFVLAFVYYFIVSLKRYKKCK